MPLIQVAGLAFRTWGEVSPEQSVVVALHGLTSTSAVWADLAARLPTVPMLAPDLPGRGGSVAAPAAPGLLGLATAVVRAVDTLGLRRVVVVGHSMGAFLAPIVVHQLGGRAVAVVLLDGGVPPEPSVLLRPLLVRTLFTIQLRRLMGTWTDVDRFTRVAEGGAADHRPDLHAGFRAWSEAVLEPREGGFRPRLDVRRIVADGVDSITRPSAPTRPAADRRPGPPAGRRPRSRRHPARVPLRRRDRSGPCGAARSYLGARPSQPRHLAV